MRAPLTHATHGRNRPRRRLRGESGQASVEFIAALPVLVLAALLVWQMILYGTVMTSAQNAARTGSRAASLHSSGEKAAMNALRPSLRKGAEITTTPGGAVRVQVHVPLLVPGIPLPLKVTEAATIPDTSGA